MLKLLFFTLSRKKCEFTKPFGYIFQYRLPHRTVLYFLVYSQDKEKQKDFKPVMSFRGTVVSTGQLYKPLAEKHKCLTSSGNIEEFCRSMWTPIL